MSEFKLSNTIKTSVEEARDIIEEYFSVVPNVEKYLRKSGEYGRNYGVSYTIGPIRRPRYFDLNYANSLKEYDRRKVLSGYERQAKNSSIQGANADWVKIAIIFIQNYIDKHKFPAKIRLTVHDEIVSSVREDLAEELMELQESMMIKAGKLFIKSLPIVVESKISTNWEK